MKAPKEIYLIEVAITPNLGWRIDPAWQSKKEGEEYNGKSKQKYIRADLVKEVAGK